MRTVGAIEGSCDGCITSRCVQNNRLALQRVCGPFERIKRREVEILVLCRVGIPSLNDNAFRRESVWRQRRFRRNSFFRFARISSFESFKMSKRLPIIYFFLSSSPRFIYAKNRPLELLLFFVWGHLLSGVGGLVAKVRGRPRCGELSPNNVGLADYSVFFVALCF